MNVTFTIRQVRMYRDKTGRETARAVGLTYNQYRFIERHPEKCSVTTAHLLSEYLDIPFNDFFYPPPTTLKV
jgi:DNA-binding XRE family transcriptional regulator